MGNLKYLASIKFDAATETWKEWKPYGETTTDVLVTTFV